MLRRSKRDELHKRKSLYEYYTYNSQEINKKYLFKRKKTLECPTRDLVLFFIVDLALVPLLVLYEADRSLFEIQMYIKTTNNI